MAHYIRRITPNTNRIIIDNLSLDAAEAEMTAIAARYGIAYNAGEFEFSAFERGDEGDEHTYRLVAA